jgi:integrase
VSAWAERLPGGGYRARFRDQSGAKRTVRDQTGRPVKYGRKTDARHAAQEALASTTRRAPEGATTKGSMTWAEWWERIKDERQGSLAPSRNASSELYMHRRWILPRWGSTPLNLITRSDVQRWVDSLAKEMEATSVRRVYAVFKATFRLALDHEVMNTSPCVSIRLPKILRRPQPYMTFDYLEQLDLAENYRMLFRLLLETGLRPSEACGLHFDQVNLDGGWLYVSRVLIRQHEGWRQRSTEIREYPKNRRVRRVPLTEQAREIILNAVGERKGSCGLRHIADGGGEASCRSPLVFVRPNGKPYLPESLHTVLRRASQAKGLPMRSPYAARRGFGTWVAESGEVDAFALQRFMGHASMDQTMVYVQATPAERSRLQNARDKREKDQ